MFFSDDLLTSKKGSSVSLIPQQARLLTRPQTASALYGKPSELDAANRQAYGHTGTSEQENYKEAARRCRPGEDV